MALTGSSEYYCPRLLDYFLIIGPKKCEESGNQLYESAILKQYPPIEHEDFPLPIETVHFCQPDPLTRDDIQNYFSSDSSSFLFTLTDKDKNRTRYGVCLNFTCKIKWDGVEPAISNPENFWDIFFYNNLTKHSTTNCEALIAIQFEKWILRLLSTPAPVPGNTFIRLKLFPEEIEPPLIFAMPDKNRLSLVDFSFYLPMELLGIQNCLKVILAILLEQKVLLKSKDYNALTMCILALTNMLYPLQYMFPVIPLLPTSLPNADQILLSPTPFLIGIPSSFLREKGKHIPMSEILLVDIDTGQVEKSDQEEQRLRICPTSPKLHH
ncbi:hypothetical protein ACTXT7_013954 [Hymenolepis weldensis]